MQSLEYAEKKENHGTGELHTVGPGKWQETLKNMENEKCTWQDLEYGKKTKKH